MVFNRASNKRSCSNSRRIFWSGFTIWRASADPSYSTATYPATAGTSGKILISDGTNIVSSTPLI